MEALRIEKDHWYIDATLGGGGHSLAIIQQGGRVLGVDQDADSISYVEDKFKVQNSKFKIGVDVKLVRGNFRDIDKLVAEAEIEAVSGILYDLGVSSHQIDTPERGFSFQREGPLDMRMSSELGVTAADLVNGLTKNELYELFITLGEEYNARAICDRIISARGVKPIVTTSELAELIRGPKRTFAKTDPATKVFQALRIAVNDELHGLTESLPKALALLSTGGRLAVISFHSLEDRIVKNVFKEFEEKNLGIIVTKKPIIPSDLEQEENRRSRSAKLRVFEKK